MVSYSNLVCYFTKKYVNSPYPKNDDSMWWENKIYTEFDSGRYCQALIILLVGHKYTEKSYKLSNLTILFKELLKNNNMSMDTFNARFDTYNHDYLLLYYPDILFLGTIIYEMTEENYKYVWFRRVHR